MSLVSGKYCGFNHFWASLLIEELARCGVRDYAIAPGGQSTPLVMAVDEHPETEAVISHDERGAAFYALGCARATGQPCAVISTSGTAVANFAPAVMEASSAKDPLLLLTADLPGEMSDTGVNQAIEQTRLFSSYLRWFFDFSAPDKNCSLPALLTAVDQAVFRMTSPYAGPVQLNCRFHAPLVDCRAPSAVSLSPRLKAWQESADPYTTYYRSEAGLGSKQLSDLVQILSSAKKGVIVAGQLPASTDFSLILDLVRVIGWPLLPAVTSGLRFGAGKEFSSNLYPHYAAYIGSSKLKNYERPDVVMHIGGDLIQHVSGEPFSNALNNYLRESPAKYILLQSHPCRQDPLHKVTHRLTGDISVICRQIAEEFSQSSSELSPLYRSTENAALSAMAAFSETCSETSLFSSLTAVLRNLPDKGGLFLANSLSIRAVDLLAAVSSKKISVASHHGVKGIDGTLAAAVGFADGLKEPTTLLIGDVAMLHDLNSLQLAANLSQPLVIIVVNDNGGSIFSYVSAKDIPQFSRYFLTPHGRDFSLAAEFCALPYARPSSLAELEREYRSALAHEGASLIELSVSRDQTIEEFSTLFKEINNEIREALKD